MKYTNILEKLLCILNLTKNSYFYIVFIIFAVLTILLLIKKIISKKTCFIINAITTTILLAITIITNIDNLSIILDDIMNNLFTNIYFPSIYVYLFVFITINIVSIITLLNKRTKKSNKIINAIAVLITNFIFILILDIISTNEIELFKKSSVFSNTNLVILLETSVNIFIVWLTSLLISKLSSIITEKLLQPKKKPVIEVPKALEIAVDNVKEIEEEYKENKFIPNALFEIKNIEENKESKFINQSATIVENNILSNSFDLSAFIPSKTDLKPINQEIPTSISETNKIMENILNNTLPVIDNQVVNNTTVKVDEKDGYTLNDYRLFNKMLKDIKEHNNSNIISIDKNLEYRLITKYSTETYNMFKKMLKNYSN